MGDTDTATEDPAMHWAWVRLAREVAKIDARSIDPELHVAVDAVMLAYRTRRRSRLTVALIWVAWRAGLAVGRRLR
jgi:hypothetical protein